ncbi:hypothetical protein ACJRO7_035446 [Eucalyptus globulus]|uniref:non-specific serine/threonine protein kinase n=1 Tax=Eucalyptus globulus TaxID=34317 RepID=A0ABD3JBR9_EUCGL
MGSSVWNLIAILIMWATSAFPNSSCTPTSEASALLRSGWWPDYVTGNGSLPPCTWPGIGCEAYGSVRIVQWKTHYWRYFNLGSMNFSLLPNLASLVLPSLALTGRIPLQICALSRLARLDLSYNSLSSELPPCLGNLTMLEELDLRDNQLRGPIPPELGTLKRLVGLYLWNNNLNGTIPPSIGNLSNLTYLDIGEIPVEFGRLTALHFLDLQTKSLSGTIPPSIGNLSNLTYLDMSGNQFLSGSVPSEIGNLKSLAYLDLSLNNFSGEIPVEFGRLTALYFLYLHNNSLSGTIPPSIGNLKSLALLNLSLNNFSREIPVEFGRLTTLIDLDLHNNSLSGTIPGSLIEHLYLRSINLSYNLFTGPISDCLVTAHSRDAFLGNKGMYIVKDLPPLRSDWTKIVLVLAIFPVFFAVLGSCFFLRRRMKRDETKEMPEKDGDFMSIWNYDGKIAYEDIVKATEDFDIKYCVGTGGYGSVYRAELPNGKIVALKKLHRFEAEDPSFDKSFRNEVKHLTSVRHRSIIRLYGFCLHQRCMFLIYEYMGRGSLFYTLRNDIEAMELDWPKRVNVIWDVAHALSYLHHDCAQPIVHRDVSTNNILLND